MSEHRLIENLNHSTLPTPEETLPTMMGNESDAVKVARKVYDKQVRRRLETLNPKGMTFQGRSTVPILVYMDDSEEPEEVDLPIRSIPAHKMEEITRAYQECAAKLPRTRSSGSEQAGEWEQDQSHPEFAEMAIALMSIGRKMSYDKVLYGIDIPLVDNNGQTVWSHRKNVYDHGAAVEVLNAMGIKEQQIADIADAIDTLSANVAISQEEDFTKKPLPR